MPVANLRDLPIPADVQAEVTEMFSASRSATDEQLREFENEVRLQVHFGGRAVVCERSPGGLRVLRDFEPGGGGVGQFVRSLPDEVRRRIIIRYPESW